MVLQMDLNIILVIIYAPVVRFWASGSGFEAYGLGGALCRRADLVHKGELGREDRYRDYFEDALPSPLHAKNENPPYAP